MNEIETFKHLEGSTIVTWEFSGAKIEKNFGCEIYALLLKSQKKVLVVELKKEKDNAVVFTAEGKFLRRINNPDSQAMCFGDVYYVGDDLTLISRRGDATMRAVVVDEDGNVLRDYETR